MRRTCLLLRTQVIIRRSPFQCLICVGLYYPWLSCYKPWFMCSSPEKIGTTLDLFVWLSLNHSMKDILKVLFGPLLVVEKICMFQLVSWRKDGWFSRRWLEIFLKRGDMSVVPPSVGVGEIGFSEIGRCLETFRTFLNKFSINFKQ